MNDETIDDKTLEELFVYLEGKTCSHNLKHTEEFLESRGINPFEVTPWLESRGGFCDCEVVMNVASRHFSDELY